MNRSSFKRPTYERRPLPAPRPVRAVAPTLFTSTVQTQPKEDVVRSEAYRRVVAAMPCVMCGISGFSQCAHANVGKGAGIKASDLESFPACCDRPGVRGCHAQLDQGALFTKSARRALEPAWSADTRRRVMAMGLWPKGLAMPSEHVHHAINIEQAAMNKGASCV